MVPKGAVSAPSWSHTLNLYLKCQFDILFYFVFPNRTYHTQWTGISLDMDWSFVTHQTEGARRIWGKWQNHSDYWDYKYKCIMNRVNRFVCLLVCLYVGMRHWDYWKGGVHIMGEICARSDPDIAHMGYYLDPLQLTIYHWIWDLG